MELVILCYDLFLQVYDMLGVTGLEERGESFYNPFLPSLVVQFLRTYIHTYIHTYMHVFGFFILSSAFVFMQQKLRTEGVARESDGAIVVFLNQTDRLVRFDSHAWARYGA